MQTVSQEIEGIAKVRNEPEEMVVAEALKLGMAKLWKETIIDHFLQGKMSRTEAVKLVGEPLIILAEKTEKAVLEDVRWGLHHA